MMWLTAGPPVAPVMHTRTAFIMRPAQHTGTDAQSAPDMHGDADTHETCWVSGRPALSAHGRARRVRARMAAPATASACSHAQSHRLLTSDEDTTRRASMHRASMHRRTLIEAGPHADVRGGIWRACSQVQLAAHVHQALERRCIRRPQLPNAHLRHVCRGRNVVRRLTSEFKGV